MKIWVDDVRPAPKEYVWCRTVYETIWAIDHIETMSSMMHDKIFWSVELIDLDHDAGDYAQYGGDYIRILDWLEETGRNYPIRIHSMNPIGRGNMRRIIRKNGWKEID